MDVTAKAWKKNSSRIRAAAMPVIGGMALVILLWQISSVFAGIQNSAHDFSNQAWNSSRQICLPCHMPHTADSTTQTPLWSHSTTRSTFTLYSSSTLDAVAGQPSGISKACLSCHDGTVALDSYAGARDYGTRFIGADGLIGTDLSNDHPISFVYDSALAVTDGDLTVPQSADTVDGVVPLFNGKVECASCHDVHNVFNQPKLLVKTNAGSALCFTCHAK